MYNNTTNDYYLKKKLSQQVPIYR